MKYLYFLRHGKAESNSNSGRDEDRALSLHGHKQIERLANILTQSNVQFDVVLHSPYRRADQTAHALHEKLPNTPKPIAFRPMECGAQWKDVRNAIIKDYSDHKHILLVGHMPDVGEMTAKLLHLDHNFALKTATLFGLALDEGLENSFPAQLKIYLEG